MQLDALFLGMMQLFQTGGHFRLAAAIDDVHMLRAETLRAARGIHGNVAAADDRNGVRTDDRRVALVAIALHEVDTGQVLVGGHNALERLALDVHEHGQACTGADEHGLEAHLLEQLVDRKDLADDHVGHDMHAHGLELLDLVGNDGLRKTEFGDTIDQHAACGVQGLKNGDLIALLGQLARTGQAGGAGADDGDLDAVALGLLGHLVDILAIPVGDKALQPADGDRLALHAAHALALTLGLLRADTAGQGGQSIRGGDDLVSAEKIALGDLCDELRNADVDGAALDALRILAVQAAACFLHGHLLGVAKGDLFEILIADVRCLLGHRGLGQSHIRHAVFLLSE